MSSIRLLGHYWNTKATWFGVVTAVLGAACLGVSTFMRNDSDVDSASPEIATVGQIIHKGERSDWIGRKLRPVYSLRYQFVDNSGAEHQGVTDVAESVWKRCRLGQTLSIRYDGDDPARSRVMLDALTERQPLPMTLAAAGAVLLLLGGISAAMGFWRAVRRIRVVCLGRPYLGRVTEKVPVRSGQAVQIGYSFRDGRGIARHGQTQAFAKEVSDSWEVDDPILVLCRDDDIFHHEVDIWGARTADLARMLPESQGRS